MKSQAGFTLVEALMAGTLSTAIPLLVLATLQINGSQLLKGSSRVRLTHAYNMVSEELQRTAYLSASAKQAPCEGTNIGERCGVRFYNADGAFRKGFRVRRPDVASPAGILEETRTADPDVWTPFQAGSEVFTVWTDLAGFALNAPGLFDVYNPGLAAAGVLEGVRVNLRPYADVDGTQEYLAVQTEAVMCRNPVP